jgi:sporulation protein YlmC with PRC-barrel domain
MEPKLGQNLMNMDVNTAQGERIGTLFNITIDMRTGEMKKLLVTPLRDSPTAKRPQFETDANGRYMIPVSRLESVQDHIVIN